MPSDKRNLITTKTTGLIFSLFDVASTLLVPFGIPQYTQCILHGLTSVLLCVPFIFADSTRYQFAVALHVASMGIVPSFSLSLDRGPSPSVLHL